MTARFYSGRRDGQVAIRDGIGTKKRLLEPRAVLFKRGEKGFASPGDGSAQIALTLLADALGDEAYALKTHEHFSRASTRDAWTQDAPVTDCDRYAAYPDDSQRKDSGVSFDSIDESSAVSACEAAVRQYPDSNRLIS